MGYKMGKIREALGRWLGVEHIRTITEFAIIDGVAVAGSGDTAAVYRGGMSIPGGWRAALLISDLLGSVPWDAYRKRADNPVELLSPTPPLLEQPAPPDTRMTTFSSWGLDLVWEGNAVGIIAARDFAGYPTAVYPVPAAQVGVRRVGFDSISALPVGAIEYSIGARTFDSSEVIHIKGPCAPGALRGMGVLEAHLTETLALVREQQRQARSISQHGVPTGKLKVSNPDATEDDMKAAKAAWLAAQRDRTVAVLNSVTDFEPLSWNPEELELVEARRYSLTELALVFGLPARYLLAGSGDSMTYSTLETERLDLLQTSSLVGHLARFEQTLSLAFPRGTVVKANLDAWLRGDTTTRYQAHATALGAGFLTVPEVRELEDLPPLPEPPALPPAPDTTDPGDDEEADPDE